MNERSNLVLGTAGHIDHGKTSLVRALTGTDTDRLQEEKRRGISIDIGFAHMSLPDGGEVSFVDVPGHERFVRNMLAGAAGIRAVMLVIAADESVMPQTREHFEICCLLGVQHGFVALTKIDRADADLLAAAQAEVEEFVAGSFLQGAPIVAVSSKTGEGLPELKAVLARLAKDIAPMEANGLTRLPIDRSFAVAGFGTVVTGTLVQGQLRTGDRVTIHPRQQALRVRGLQVHGHPVETAHAGQRTAVNLAGVERENIQRGHTLTHVNEIRTTRTIDASVEWLRTTETPQRRTEVFVHLGTQEISGSLKVLKEASDRTFLARIVLAGPTIALPGDRFIVRRPSPAETLGGGIVLDAFPKRRMGNAKSAERLQILSKASMSERIEMLAEESPSGQTITRLVQLLGLSPEEIRNLAIRSSKLILAENTDRIFTQSLLNTLRSTLLKWLAEFHQQNPSAAGASLRDIRQMMPPEMEETVLNGWDAVRVNGEVVALKTHRAELTGDETIALKKIEALFSEAGNQPPPLEDALAMAGPNLKQARTCFEMLIKRQILVRISPALTFHTRAVEQMRSAVLQHKGQTFSVPQFKDWTRISRKYAIPVLEFFDRERITRREGDLRRVL